MAVYVSMGAAGITTTVAAGLALHRWLRPKFAVTVNCWFCHQNTKVPYGNKNCWDCPYCEQYNGFNDSGDYNKPIPAQHEEFFNETPNQNRSREYTDNCNSFKNGFCNQCNANQQMKMAALTHFVPLNEENYSDEMNDYKTYLERVYRLCRKCELVLRDTLGQQDSFLRPKLLEWRSKRNSCSSSTKSSIFENAFIKKVYSSTIYFYFYILSLIIYSLTTVLLLFRSEFIDYARDNEWTQFILPLYVLNGTGSLVDQLGYEISLILFAIGILFKKHDVRFVDLLTLLLHLTQAILNSQFASCSDDDNYYLNFLNEEYVRSVILYSTLVLLMCSCVSSLYPKKVVKYVTKSCFANKSGDTSTKAWIQNKIKAEKQLRKKTKGNLQTSLGAMSLGTPRKSNSNAGIFRTHDYKPSTPTPVINYLNDEMRSRRPILSPPRLASPQPYSTWPFINCWQQPQSNWTPSMNCRMTSSPNYINFPQFHENGNLYSSLPANNSFYCPSYPSSRVGSVYGGCDEAPFYDQQCHNFNCVSQQDVTQSYESNMTRKRCSEKGTNSSKSSSSTCPVDTTSNLNLSENEGTESCFHSWQNLVLVLSVVLNVVAAIFMLKDSKLKFAVI